MSEEIIQGFRLSPQQKRLWLLEPHGSSYPFWARCAVRIQGDLDEASLERVIATSTSKHEILRTTFRLLPGMTVPVQVISDEAQVSLKRHDLSGFSNRDQEAIIEQLFSDAGQRQPTFDTLPLLNAELIRLAPDTHVLLLSLPALCGDSQSLRNFVVQIAGLYGSRLAATDSNSEAMQYADFAEWQNELLESEESAAGRQHWKRDISEAPAIKMPFQNGTADNFQPAKIAIDIKQQTADRIREIAGNTGGTASSFVLACWQVLIWRLTGCSDLVLGRSFDDRKYEELENSLGLISRYVPIQTQFDNEAESLLELLKRVGEEQQAAHKWQEYFSWEMPEHRQGTFGDYFPVCFESRQVLPTFPVNNLTFSLCNLDACIDRFQLKLVFQENNPAPELELYYNARAFALEDVQRLADELQTLLEAAGKAPEVAIAELEILGEAERERLLVEFNNTASETESTFIQELFEAQAARVPDRTAVEYESNKLTYADLNRRANQLAHHLRKLAVGPDVPVGLCLDRSVDSIVALLGIIKSGGAYVALEPGLPIERLQTMLKDVGAQVVVTGQLFASEFSDYRTVCLDTEAELLAAESSDNPKSAICGENLVYVMFTSGSTGKPKGVGVEHRQLINYLEAITDRLDLPARGSFAMVSTLAADLGLTVLFPPLINGGTLHLISEECATSPDALADYFTEHPIDCLKIVPSHLAALLSGSRPADILPRRRLILGGEACSLDLIRRLEKMAPSCVVFNHYGPTETTVGVIAGPIDFNQSQDSTSVPLGRPLANTRAYVLDKYHRLVPLGTPGELHIGGDCVARGYFNRPETTAEKFIPDPFGGPIGARLYRTGDLARHLGDGRIEFLGRVDHQIKVRGYRVEPGEIETQLRAHPAVGETVVVAREEQPGERRVVAYLVLKDSHTPPAAHELRTFLTESLPEHMVPSAFVFLDQLPLTSNGKIDRKALPAPDLHGDSKTFVAPRNPVEAQLAKIWIDVLGVDQIGIHDNFFELGGDSILSIQIIARSNNAGLRLTPRQLFQFQTIAELATVALDGVAPQIDQGLVTGEVPLSPVQARFFELNQPELHYYNQAMLLQVRDALDPALLKDAVERLLIHHDALRIRFSHGPHGWQQVVVEPGGPVPVEWLDVSRLSQLEQEESLKSHALRLQASLDLQDGPLIRVAFFHFGPQQTNYLLIVIHHLVVDNVSWRVLLEDLEMLYRASQENGLPSLPPKTTSFKSWVEQLVQHARSKAVRDELPYWLSQSSQPIASLPVDTPGGSNSVVSARTISVSLDVTETNALLRNVPTVYRTEINEVLLAALARTFTQSIGAPSLLLDLEGHGREEIVQGLDLSRTVGWFTTIFPVVLNIGRDETPIDALRSVKEQLRSIPARGIGYGLLRYLATADIGEQLRALPQPQIRFNYLGQLDRLLNESSMFTVAPQSSGPTQTSRAIRAYLLNIIASVSKGQLRVDWTYSENIHDRGTVERIAERYIEELRLLVTDKKTVAGTAYSPSDFPNAKLNREDLDKVLAKLRS